LPSRPHYDALIAALMSPFACRDQRFGLVDAVATPGQCCGSSGLTLSGRFGMDVHATRAYCSNLSSRASLASRTHSGTRYDPSVNDTLLTTRRGTDSRTLPSPASCRRDPCFTGDDSDARDARLPASSGQEDPAYGRRQRSNDMRRRSTLIDAENVRLLQQREKTLDLLAGSHIDRLVPGQR
jgi:hypothetical protein